MKFSSINRNSLNDGVYYYCAHCEHWFGKWQPTPNQQCPDCGWLWKNAQGTFTKKSHTAVIPSPSPAPVENPGGATPVLIVLLILVGGYWGYVAIVQPMVASAWRQTQIAWSNFTEGAGVVLGFIGSLLLSLVVLAGVTLLLFALFRYLIYLIILIFSAIAAIFVREEYQSSPQERANSILNEHSFLVGTLTNLISSFCALLIASWIFQRPPDYWDFGFQFVIALLIEMVVFESSQRVVKMAHY